MYLTGQMFPKPWQEPENKQPMIKKNIDYYGKIDKKTTMTNK
jgi:hypothetical protein